MAKKIISKSMLWKVCNGYRNLRVDKAKQVAKITNTDWSMWVDPDKASARKKYEKALELLGAAED